MGDRARPWSLARRSHALWVLGAALLLTMPFLGLSGLAHSEGFRVYPGWEMVDRDDWLLVRLFEQPYLRKPPAMPWACALSSLVFGRNEFSARFPSALAIALGALVTMAIAQRWFGRPWGLVAGLAFVLLPLWWWYPSVARSAEIEALHNLFVVAASLLTLHVLLLPALVAGPTPRPAKALLTLAIVASIAGMLLSKGPAGAPVVFASLIVGLWMRRSLVRSAHGPHAADSRAGLAPWTVLLAFACAACVFGAWALLAHQAAARQAVPPVVEPPTRFLYKPERLLGIAALPIAALASGLPHALALFPLGARTPTGPGRLGPAIMARALLATVALALCFFVLAGVSNNRYAMPAIALLPVCVGAAGWAASRRAARPTRFVRALRPTGAVLAILAVGLSAYGEHRRITRTTGKDAGLALGVALAQSAAGATGPGKVVELWGDECFDTRPEVVRAVVDEAQARGQPVRARWMPRAVRPPSERVALPEPGSFLLLRTDDRPRAHDERPELPEYAELLPRLERIASQDVHVFRFELFRVRAAPK